MLCYSCAYAREDGVCTITIDSVLDHPYLFYTDDGGCDAYCPVEV